MKTTTILTALFAAFATSTGSAVDYFFNVANGDWNAAGSWTPAGPPGGGGGNFAFVNNGGIASITADIPVIQDPFIGRGVGNSGTVNHSAGNHNNVGWIFIGDLGGTGTYNLTGPGNTLGSGNLSTGRIYLGGLRGATPGGNGTMRVNTTGTVTAGSDFSVGTRGATGSLTITAGTVNANSWMIVGETEGGVGGSTGTVVQDGGNVTASAVDGNGRFWIGSQEGAAGPASNGSYTINNGNFTARNAIIGKNYTGTFNQNGGNVTLNNTVNDATEHRLGEAAGSTGNYNLTNGILTLNHNFQIGASGTGNFIQTGGTVNANLGFPVVGRFAGGTGTLSISAGSFNQLDVGTQLIVGEAGTGTLTISGSGEVNVANILSVGHTATGNGTVNLNGGILFTNIITRNLAGASQLNFNGGVLKARSNQVEFFPNFNAATTQLQAGGLKFDSNGFTVATSVGLDGVGGVTKQGAGTLGLTGATTFSGATIINAGTLEAAAANALGGTSNVTLNSGGSLLLSNIGTTNRINNAATITMSGGTIGFSGNITEASSPGTGALTLTANSIIDFAGGNSIINFGASNLAAWTGGAILSIYNWDGLYTGGGNDQVLFGSDATGLTQSQLNQVSFFSGPGTGFLGTAFILSNGELVPVPEPSAVFTVLGLLGLVGYRERRRFRRD